MACEPRRALAVPSTPQVHRARPEQDFNSLDAQREAAEAFIKSQAHEGWRCLPSATMMAASREAPWSAPP
jgi:hypothetical protein